MDRMIGDLDRKATSLFPRGSCGNNTPETLKITLMLLLLLLLLFENGFYVAQAGLYTSDPPAFTP